MGRYDCVILYNATSVVEAAEGSREQLFPSNIIRDEVCAIEDSLREIGFNAYVLSVEQFSKDVVLTLSRISPKFIFNLCEELDGCAELEMCMAGFLELLGVPYTGSGPFALGLALNKYHVKQILRSSRISVARDILYAPGQKPRFDSITFPVIVKPVHEDGSLGINSSSVCHDAAQLREQLEYIHDTYQQEALVEDYLEGREFNISIMGDEKPQVLAISEIDFSGMPNGEPKIVSYRAKWDEESPMYRCTVPICPAEVSTRMSTRIKDIALRSYKCIGCRDYGRVDMRADVRGNLYVLEVNPNPDISPQAGFARAAKVAGYSYAEVIHEISKFALARGERVPSMVYAS